ncbi:hypothetical protein C3E93_28500, partial [Klebsiella pneumoniae]
MLSDNLLALGAQYGWQLAGMMLMGAASMSSTGSCTVAWRRVSNRADMLSDNLLALGAQYGWQLAGMMLMGAA